MDTWCTNSSKSCCRPYQIQMFLSVLPVKSIWNGSTAKQSRLYRPRTKCTEICHFPLPCLSVWNRVFPHTPPPLHTRPKCPHCTVRHHQLNWTQETLRCRLSDWGFYSIAFSLLGFFTGGMTAVTVPDEYFCSTFREYCAHIQSSSFCSVEWNVYIYTINTKDDCHCGRSQPTNQLSIQTLPVFLACLCERGSWINISSAHLNRVSLKEAPEELPTFFVMWDQQHVWGQCTCMCFNPLSCCLRFVTTLFV